MRCVSTRDFERRLAHLATIISEIIWGDDLGIMWRMLPTTNNCNRTWSRWWPRLEFAGQVNSLLSSGFVSVLHRTLSYDFSLFPCWRAMFFPKSYGTVTECCRFHSKACIFHSIACDWAFLLKSSLSSSPRRGFLLTGKTWCFFVLFFNKKLCRFLMK